MTMKMPMLPSPLPPLLTALLLACSANEPSPPLPPDPSDELLHVFPTDRVPAVELELAGGIAPLIKALLTDGSMDYVEGAFRFDDELQDPVGIRLKGTLKAGMGQKEDKYSFKVNFDLFEAPHFHELDSVHLLNDKPDPSHMREILASRMYRAMGIPAARSTSVTLKVGGQDQGVYTLVQEIDKRFLKVWFGTESGADDGNLYKCVAPGCSLVYRGDKKEHYIIKSCEEPNGCGFVLKTNEDDPSLNDYSDLIAFLDLVNNTPDDAFAEAIEAVFDVDLYLRYLAVAVVISDYEGYLGRLDSFFLYHRPDNDKWVLLPWDLNKTYGSSDCKTSEEHTGGPLFPPWCGESERPLGKRILAVSAWRDQYEDYVRELLDGYFTEEIQAGWIQEIDLLIRDLVAADPIPLFPFDDYDDSVGYDGSDWDPMNLLEFVQDRRAFLESELK